MKNKKPKKSKGVKSQSNEAIISNDFRQEFGKKFGFVDNKLSEREMFIEDYFLKMAKAKL